LVSIVTDREDVRRHFIFPLSSIGKYNSISVDWKAAIGVDGHTEKSRVGLKNTNIMVSNCQYNSYIVCKIKLFISKTLRNQSLNIQVLGKNV
jgi:hypothetical protein